MALADAEDEAKITLAVFEEYSEIDAENGAEARLVVPV